MNIIVCERKFVLVYFLELNEKNNQMVLIAYLLSETGIYPPKVNQSHFLCSQKMRLIKESYPDMLKNPNRSARVDGILVI